MLRPAEKYHVANIKMPADSRAVEFIHEAGCFHRAEQKVVPNVFDRQLYAEFFRQGNDFAQFGLVALVSVGVRDAVAGPAGHDEHRRGSVSLGIAESLHDAFNRFSAFGRIRAGERSRDFA